MEQLHFSIECRRFHLSRLDLPTQQRSHHAGCPACPLQLLLPWSPELLFPKIVSPTSTHLQLHAEHLGRPPSTAETAMLYSSLCLTRLWTIQVSLQVHAESSTNLHALNISYGQPITRIFYINRAKKQEQHCSGEPDNIASRPNNLATDDNSNFTYQTFTHLLHCKACSLLSNSLQRGIINLWTWLGRSYRTVKF